VDVSPSDGGSIEVNTVTPTHYPTNMTFASGDSVTLKAVPNPGYEFISWSGDLSSKKNPDIIKITCNTKISASFSQGTHILTMDVEGSGFTNPEVGEYSYTQGTTVTIEAIPASGWQFERWIGDVAEPKSATTVLTINSNKTVTAKFSQPSSNWYLITGIVASVIVIGVATWLVVKGRFA